MNSPVLQKLGWTEQDSVAFAQLDANELFPARIVEQRRSRFIAHAHDGTWKAVLPLRSEMSPGIGDWVALRGEQGLAVIEKVLRSEKQPATE